MKMICGCCGKEFEEENANLDSIIDLISPMVKWGDLGTTFYDYHMRQQEIGKMMLYSKCENCRKMKKYRMFIVDYDTDFMSPFFKRMNKE